MKGYILSVTTANPGDHDVEAFHVEMRREGPRRDAEDDEGQGATLYLEVRHRESQGQGMAMAPESARHIRHGGVEGAGVVLLELRAHGDGHHK